MYTNYIENANYKEFKAQFNSIFIPQYTKIQPKITT